MLDSSHSQRFGIQHGTDVTPFDVVILGTGFITVRTHCQLQGAFLTNCDSMPQGKYFVSVTGSNGQTLEEYHKGQGGPSAYAGGVCVPGFPNYFFIGGVLSRRSGR